MSEFYVRRRRQWLFNGPAYLVAIGFLVMLPISFAQAVANTNTTQPPLLNDAQVRVEGVKGGVADGVDVVAHIPTSTAQSFEGALTAQQLPDLFNAVDENAIRRVVNESFQVDTFDKYLLKEFNNAMDEASRQEMLAWYASSMGARARQAELDNTLLTQEQRFEDYQVFLRRYPVEPIRQQLILNLDFTLNATEAAVDMMTSMQVAFNMSLSQFMPAEYRLGRQEILDMVKQDQELLLQQYEQQTQEVLLFTYQELSNEELAQLDEAMATDAGQAFVTAINNGIKKGMFAASLDLGDGLGALVEQAPQSPGI